MATQQLEPTLSRLSTASAREEEEVLRIYIAYDQLYLTDLHRVLQPLAQAYSYLSAAESFRSRAASRSVKYDAMLGRRQYLESSRPLRVESIATGQSIILICKGAVDVIVALAEIAKGVFGAAEKYWKMKKQKAALAHPEAAARSRSGRAHQQAESELKELANYVEKTTRITEFHLQLDGLTWTHTKTTASELESSRG